MELKDLYIKLNNLLDLQERRDLTKREQEELDKLKKLRNKLDPDWYKHAQAIFNIADNGLRLCLVADFENENLK